MTPSLVARRNGKFSLLFTGDRHSYLDPSKSKLSEKPLGGALRTAKFITDSRAIEQSLLVLDAGDFLRGTLYYEKFKGRADIEFMNAAGYDIVAIGNHDLDGGLEPLQELLKEGKFKKLCANILCENKPCFTPYVMLEIGNLSVAVVGIMGPDAWGTVHPLSKTNLTLEDPSTILDKLLPEIRPQVDIIILLSHSGIKQDRVYAKLHPLIDVIIGGHSHTYMTEHEEEGGVAIFHAECYGHLVGKMSIEVKDGTVFKQSCVELMDDRYDLTIDDSDPFPQLTCFQHEITIAFAEVLMECPNTIARGELRKGLTQLGSGICDILQKAADTDVAVMLAGSIKKDIEPGAFTLKNLYQLLPYNESLLVARMKGSVLLQLFQEGHNRWGQGQRHFQYSGITLEVNDSLITQATIRQKPVDPDAIYKCAVTDFFLLREEWLSTQLEGSEIKYEDLRIPFAHMLRNGDTTLLSKNSG